jgi:hypothetical protein
MISKTTCIRNLAVWVFAAALFWSAGVWAQTLQEPSNKVVLIVDGSGSYKPRQAEAVRRAVALLDEMSQTRLHRWETETDRISIISLDAMPELLWSGSLQELKAMESKGWTERFSARKDLSSCTDVARAFQLAVQHLDGDPRYVSKYLIIFSDLIHEPPTKSVRTCQKPVYGPPEDLPWEGLKDVSITVFWVPSDQKFIWRQTTEKLGLASNFALYTESESPAVKIAPPPRPVIKTTEEDRAKDRASFIETGKTAGKWAAIALGMIVLVPAVPLIVRRLTRGRAPQTVSPLRGAVPPLPVAGRRPGGPAPHGSPRIVRPLPPNNNPRHR